MICGICKGELTSEAFLTNGADGGAHVSCLDNLGPQKVRREKLPAETDLDLYHAEASDNGAVTEERSE